MKIGLVCPYNIFRGGGVQECVFALQDELLARGHEVKIITPQPRDAVGEQLDNVILLGGATEVKSFHTTSQISVSVNSDLLNDMLDKEKFDVLHFHEPWVPILSRQILARSHAVNIATFHAKLPDTVMHRTIEKVITPYTRSVLKNLDQLTAVSAAAAEYVSSLTTRSIDIVPNGIDLTKYAHHSHAPKNTEATILYIGRLERRKGLSYLLRAFRDLQLKYPSTRLQLAGNGADQRKLRIEADSYGLANVEFLGYVSEADKLRLLRKADLFCSPARYGESFGIVLLEAMASGLPIVAGDNPGYNSVLKERGQISLVNPQDITAFANRLELLLFDQQLRTLWQTWAKNYVQQFEYKKVVDQYEALYLKAKG